MTKKNQEVATVGSTDVAAAQDYGSYAGQGFDNTSGDDFSLAFLGILQTLSKAVESGQYEPGMVMNTAIDKAISGKEGFGFIPVLTQRHYVEWIPRKKGGGRVADYAPDSPAVLEAKQEAEDQFKLKIGENNLIDTFYVFGLMVGNNEFYRACIPFTSTKIKKYKGWMTQANGLKFTNTKGEEIQLPLFAHMYHLSTIEESRPGGNSFNWSISLFGESAQDSMVPTNGRAFQEAIKFYQDLKKDMDKINFAKEAVVGETTNSDADPEDM